MSEDVFEIVGGHTRSGKDAWNIAAPAAMAGMFSLRGGFVQAGTLRVSFDLIRTLPAGVSVLFYPRNYATSVGVFLVLNFADVRDLRAVLESPLGEAPWFWVATQCTAAAPENLHAIESSRHVSITMAAKLMGEKLYASQHARTQLTT